MDVALRLCKVQISEILFIFVTWSRSNGRFNWLISTACIEHDMPLCHVNPKMQSWFCWIPTSKSVVKEEDLENIRDSAPWHIFLISSRHFSNHFQCAIREHSLRCIHWFLRFHIEMTILFDVRLTFAWTHTILFMHWNRNCETQQIKSKII